MSETNDGLEEVAGGGEGRLSKIVALVLVVALVIIGVGAIGQFAGTGWFGYRSFLYGSGDLYLVNLGEAPVEVSVAGAEPITIPAEDARLVPVVGGDNEVVVHTGQGDEVERFVVHTEDSDGLVKVAPAPQRCLVAVDISPYYGAGDKAKLRILEKLGPDERVYVPGSRNVVWPREPFPPRLTAEGGPGVWIETVGCPLLDDEEQGFLEAYLIKRIEDRMARALGEPAPPPRRPAGP